MENRICFSELQKKLPDKQLEIINILYTKLKTSGGNKGRTSHIVKQKLITIQDLYERLVENDWKCYYSKHDFNCDINYLRPSIERLDSNDSYTKENTVVILELINNMKNSYSMEEFKRGIKSVSDGKIDDDVDYIPNETHIGGQKSKKNLKTWKPPSLNKPVKMSESQVYIYECLVDIIEFKTNIEIRELIKIKNKIDCTKETVNHALNTFYKNGYVNKEKKGNCFLWKLKTQEEIIILNNNLKFPCGRCKKEYNLNYYRHREARGILTKDLDCNLIHTICTKCNTESTNRYCNGKPQNFILRLINGRKNKKGDIDKNNINQIIKDTCHISGIPIIYNKSSNMFNQASPDRIDNTIGYNIGNVRIICLMLNLAKKNFNISDEELMKYVKLINSNLHNF
jgi:hypothetical protein